MANIISINGRKVDIDALNESIDWQEVLGTDKRFCPWHKDTLLPNLHIYSDHVYCFAGCGAHTGYEYLMKEEGITFHQAVEKAQKYVGTGGFLAAAARKSSKPKVLPVDMELVDNMQSQLLGMTPDDAPVYYLLVTRGLSNKVIRGCKIGWNGYSFSIPHMVDNKCTNIKFRVHPEYNTWYDDEGGAHARMRYTSLPGHSFTQLYPHDYFLSHHFESPVVILVEGELDALYLLSQGLSALSIPSGVGTPLNAYISFLKQYKYILVAFDMDKAGQAGWDRMKTKTDAIGQTEVQMLSPSTVRRITWPAELGKDVSEAGMVVVEPLKEYVRALEKE